ncbi:hypothetical protein [Paenibacillus radicis (ex Gao et al. 2016)]|uniref:Uncharacterized protein n=1 Tax=Paenibacillus radicis (ex Gao et al. 2016) TaxID=1737354 RepID=A0A917H9T6_9BACL|nr:hypothetical protein [Paenibacillus radicis (ex Gao et al. 2016)]GGG72625.1 hypothetical protein GCM10010918_30620 [Paenibacillus radicis (ex Gao et al. 2016)]
MKKAIGIALSVLGIMISLATFNPLYLIYQEKQIQRSLDHQYDITQKDLINNQLEFNNNMMKIVEEPSGDVVNLQVILNGEPLAGPIAAQLSNDNVTYTKRVWVNAFAIRESGNRNREDDLLAIVTMPELNKWNIYYVNHLNQVETKSMDAENKSKNPLDIRLVKYSGASLMGYKSDIQYASANPFALVIPVVIFIVGILLTAAGFILWLRVWVRNKGPNSMEKRPLA